GDAASRHPLTQALDLMGVSLLTVLTTVAGFCGGMWCWYAFSWRWYPALPLLAVGLLLATVTSGLCALGALLSFAVLCTNYAVTQWTGLAIGAVAAGTVILVASPFVAFWRRALETSRREV